jgi:hypothetical protein
MASSLGDDYDFARALVDAMLHQTTSRMENVMAEDLNEKAKKEVVVAEIVHSGDKITLPVGMTYGDAIENIKRRQKYMQEEVVISETFNVFPWDGAHALDLVLTNRYGFSPAEAIPTFFGPIPPKMMTIDVDYGQVKKVPWGRFSLPAVDGFIQTSYERKRGLIQFKLDASIKRIDEANIQKLFVELREALKTISIYRGKAFKMRFRQDDGDLLEMPEPQFIETKDITESMLIYSKPVHDAVETSLFTPIKRLADCRANGIPIKRGVLLGGTFGTGKSLAAKVASRLAVDNGITFMYVARADELADAVQFAKQYNDPACVIFCEDIDRTMNGARSEAMDDILNIIDGIDTKNSNIIVVLTTNDLDGINPAMLRPGRLDAVINVTPPDAEAVERLIRHYGAKAIDKDEDLTEACKLLDGKIPAVIEEVVKRAKLAQVSLQEPGTMVRKLTGEALRISAQSMDGQLALLYKDRSPSPASVDSILREIVEGVVENRTQVTAKKVDEIHERFID